ncbi:TetR/AcrR family transcriptional regulator [Planobispora longispora]|uniref:TetR/AcrR family transcriptional regulator n=1 Tax=Planobispora longispora TaxID=28887 RepID=UPI0019423AA9|nr:TetR/AcrR family transcriptional regulator [Planobispora longispora]BFE80229.1 TetR/AcrR family transcriptional regulator [Planobispora longispora]
MGRPAKFGNDQILDAAAELAAEGGQAAVTVSAIAARLGAPSGSIYHRYASRDLLVAHLWIRAVRRFQEGYLEAVRRADPRAAVEAAVAHVIRWPAGRPAEARLLLLHRREDLLDSWPAELADDLRGLNEEVREALADLVRRYFGADVPDGPERMVFALVDIPYAAVRRHLLAGRRPPGSAERMAILAARAVLEA